MVDKLKEIEDKLKEMQRKLKEKEGEIIHTLAEDERIYHPEVLLRLVWELRSIRKTLDWLKDEDEK